MESGVLKAGLYSKHIASPYRDGGRKRSGVVAASKRLEAKEEEVIFVVSHDHSLLKLKSLSVLEGTGLYGLNNSYFITDKGGNVYCREGNRGENRRILFDF